MKMKRRLRKKTDEEVLYTRNIFIYVCIVLNLAGLDVLYIFFFVRFYLFFFVRVCGVARYYLIL